MTRIISITLNVPETYQVEELTRQLTEYGERLIARSKPSAKPRRRPSQDFLKSFMLPKGTTPEQLIDEHLQEKYTKGTVPFVYSKLECIAAPFV